MRIFLFLALIAMVIVVMSNVVVAEAVVAFVDSPYTITTACIRNGQLRANASAYITIYDSSGAVIVPQTNETPSGNGTFSFIYTFTVVGGYSTKETCDFLDFLADGSTQINVFKPSFGPALPQFRFFTIAD